MRFWLLYFAKTGGIGVRVKVVTEILVGDGEGSVQHRGPGLRGLAWIHSEGKAKRNCSRLGHGEWERGFRDARLLWLSCSGWFQGRWRLHWIRRRCWLCCWVLQGLCAVIRSPGSLPGTRHRSSWCISPKVGCRWREALGGCSGFWLGSSEGWLWHDDGPGTVGEQWVEGIWWYLNS